MEVAERINAFVKLGLVLKNWDKDSFEKVAYKAQSENPWFTLESIDLAVKGVAHLLEENGLRRWMGNYQEKIEIPKIVGIVMAGNIPLVGFHDLMSTLLSGHFAAIKVSSQDSILTRELVKMLIEIEPRFKKLLEIRERLTGIDAVIATGSDNTGRYFEYYFKDIPRIIRKNRTSIAILDSSETTEELAELGKDIFWYFGLGCRNVSKLLVPVGYKADTFFESIEIFNEVGNHNKFKNNYEYYRSIFLVNSTPHLDNGFLIWLPSKDFVSPVSVLYIEEYASKEEVTSYLDTNREKLQCTVGHGYTSFGKAQLPEVWEYADNVDTMRFLLDLK